MADFTITFTVPDAEAPGIIADLAAARGYQPTVFDDQRKELPNPVQPLEFIKGSIAKDLFAQVGQLRAARAGQVASDAALADAQKLGASVVVK